MGSGRESRKKKRRVSEPVLYSYIKKRKEKKKTGKFGLIEEGDGAL